MSGFVSLKEYVYEYIANQISNGELKPDEKINENKICEELNISRTPVREALIQLSTEGFLENIPRKGFMIRKLDKKKAMEIYVILGILDGFAARLACSRLSKKELGNMSFYVKGMDVAIADANYDMYYKQKDEFHKVYMAQCDNESLVNLISLAKMKFLRKRYFVGQEETLARTLTDINKEHKKIVELFYEKNEEGLEEYIRNVYWEPSKAHLETL